MKTNSKTQWQDWLLSEAKVRNIFGVKNAGSFKEIAYSLRLRPVQRGRISYYTRGDVEKCIRENFGSKAEEALAAI